MKLTSKFLAVLMSVSLMPVLILAVLSYRNSRSAIEQMTKNHLTAINQIKKKEIETWIEGNAVTLEILSRNPSFKTKFSHAIKGHDLVKPDHIKFHKELCDGYLKPVMQGGAFTEIFIIRIPDGRILMSTDLFQQGKYCENRPFFTEGIKGPFVQNLYFSLPLQQATMVISTPLKGINGNPLAVIAGRVNLERLSKIMEKTSGLSQSEDTYLVNSFNHFVTEPRFGNGYALRKSTYTRGVTLALNGQTGTCSYPDYRGEPVIGAYAWIPERKLALLTEIDQHEAFKPIEVLRTNISILGLSVTVVVTMISLLASKSLTRPLENLTRYAQLMGQGKLDIHIEKTTHDEIGELTQAFSHMAGQLQTIMVSKSYLENEIEERKKTETRLNTALNDLARSNRDLEQFAHVTSHDLKEPLRMVRSYLDLIQDHLSGALDDSLETFIHFAQEGAVRMETMINDLLSFSRISTKGKTLSEVCSQKAFDAAKQNLFIAIRESGAEITTSALPMVKADDTQLVQIFQNLVSNAIKFSIGKPRIHVSADIEGAMCRFSVADNGIGIDEKHKDRIFNLFQRLHSRESFPGTGIGLALCRRMVERHGGAIWFESNPGKGSVFYFTMEAGGAVPIVKGGNV